MYSKQKSLNFGRYVPNDKVLNKKIPENPKYKHVKPAVNTGKNVQKRIEELKEKQKNINHKKDEVFKRVKVSAFINLAVTVASEFLSNGSETVNEPDNTETTKGIDLSERRGLTNVLMGIGELDLVNDKRRIRSSPLKPVKLMPYLLLDVRDEDAFKKCHIITAKHYPSSMLSRSIGFDIEDMKIFKNSQNRIIVLYDDDESIATRVATTLVERGYNNVYLLTGGLKLVLEFCPSGFTTSSQVSPFYMLSQGASSAVQTNIGKEYLSQEDIDTIENFMHPDRVNGSVWSSRSSQSTRSPSLRTSHRSCLSTSSASRASSTSRYTTTRSSFSPEKKSQASTSSKTSLTSRTRSSTQTRLRPVVDERTRNFKKAPWK